MLIRDAGPELLLITQADHAALAARIMECWQLDGFPRNPRRNQLLQATRLHDIGWRQLDAEPIVDAETGLPHDVSNVPLAIRQGAWPSAVAELARQDKYIAALVAQHALTVYRRYQTDANWRKFFLEMARLRDEMLGDFDRPQFLDDYAIIAMGDRWSLAFCCGWQQPQTMGVYTCTPHPNLHGALLDIDPDPFAGATVSFEIDARKIPARRYLSDADLRNTLNNAPAIRLTGSINAKRPGACRQEPGRMVADKATC